VFHVVGSYTGRLLRGARVADLRVQRATRMEMAINLRVAKTLGLAIPVARLGRADIALKRTPRSKSRRNSCLRCSGRCCRWKAHQIDIPCLVWPLASDRLAFRGAEDSRSGRAQLPYLVKLFGCYADPLR